MKKQSINRKGIFCHRAIETFDIYGFSGKTGIL
jgi:hypothetical protein